MTWRAEWSGGADEGRQPKIRLRRLPTSGLPYERPRATRALRWGAPQTADPRTPGPEKHQKSFRRVGESFLAGIRVAHKRLQEQNPAPPPPSSKTYISCKNSSGARPSLFQKTLERVDFDEARGWKKNMRKHEYPR